VRSFQTTKSLADLSTFGIGGPAKYFIAATTIEEMQEILAYCNGQNLPFLIVGKGSNSLFDDKGFNGLVIHNKIAFCEIEENTVFVGAGYSFSLLGVQTARKGLSGLEFACGIPASVGGAVFMNAGANGQEISEVVSKVLFLTEKGEKKTYSREEITFSYRASTFQNLKGAIVAAEFILTPHFEARQKQLGIISYRTKTQPLKDQSCGCVFRNPTGESAGALIERCGLKGKQIGGAAVSTVHGNFIINEEKATAKDVLALAKQIRQSVKEMTGIELEMELRTIPYE